MRRRFSLGAEIVRRADDAAAHVMLPETIRDHAGQERPGAGVRVREPVGEGEARIGGVRGLFVGSRHHLEGAGVDLRTFPFRFAADEEMDVAAAIAGGGEDVGEVRLRHRDALTSMSSIAWCSLSQSASSRRNQRRATIRWSSPCVVFTFGRSQRRSHFLADAGTRRAHSHQRGSRLASASDTRGRPIARQRRRTSS